MESWQIVLTLISAVVGVGGGGAYYQAHKSAQTGMASTEVEARKQATASWDQFTERIMNEVRRQDEKIARLEGELRDLRTDLNAERGRYRHAISYARALNYWIARHITVPEGTPPPPDPPDVIAEDL